MTIEGAHEEADDQDLQAFSALVAREMLHVPARNYSDKYASAVLDPDSRHNAIAWLFKVYPRVCRGMGEDPRSSGGSLELGVWVRFFSSCCFPLRKGSSRLRSFVE
jgi:hypothetical protein